MQATTDTAQLITLDWLITADEIALFRALRLIRVYRKTIERNMYAHPADTESNQLRQAEINRMQSIRKLILFRLTDYRL